MSVETLKSYSTIAVLFLLSCLSALTLTAKPTSLPKPFDRYRAVVFTSHGCSACAQVRPELNQLESTEDVRVVRLPDVERVWERLTSEGVMLSEQLPSIAYADGSTDSGTAAVKSLAAGYGPASRARMGGILAHIRGPVGGLLGLALLGLLWRTEKRPAGVETLLALVVAAWALTYKLSGLCLTCSTGPTSTVIAIAGLLSTLVLSFMLMRPIAWLRWLPAVAFGAAGLALLSQFSGLAPACPPCLIAGIAIVFAARQIGRVRTSPFANRKVLAWLALPASCALVFAGSTSRNARDESFLTPEGSLVPAELARKVPELRDGRAKLVVFSTASCDLCTTMGPEIAEFRKKHPTVGVQVFGPDRYQDSAVSELRNFLNPAGLYPATYVLDADNRVVASMIQWGFADRDALGEVLEGKAVGVRYWSYGMDNMGYALLMGLGKDQRSPLERVRKMAETKGPILALPERMRKEGADFTFRSPAHPRDTPGAVQPIEMENLRDLANEYRRYCFAITPTGFLTCPSGPEVFEGRRN